MENKSGLKTIVKAGVRMQAMGIITREKVSWVLYVVLLMFRIFACPFLVGYVHPDEFFQGGQELFFGCPPTIPWEFEPSNALRSIIPPTLLTWFPLKIYNWLRLLIKSGMSLDEMSVGMGSLTGTEVLIVPRIACSVFSVLTVDWAVWSIYESVHKQNTRTTTSGVPIPVLLLASAWPTLIMLTRPFSNSMETYILALLMATVLTIEVNDKHEIFHKSSIDLNFCWKVGTVSALGIFTRFTFVFFAFPVLLVLLNNLVRSFGIRQGTIWKKLGWMGISFVFVALGIIWADTSFYSSRVVDDKTGSPGNNNLRSLFDNRPFILTPFNALTYNSKVSNLKDHGLHPRWTHALVNMLIMYGPLALVTYFLIGTTLWKYPSRTATIIRCNFTWIVSSAVVVFGLGFLSLAPHQEPRFVLPLLVPLVLLGEKPIQRYPTSGAFVWGLFNLILFTLFGLLHQGGVTQSLLSVGSTDKWMQQSRPTAWIYMRTYMPPTFLTRMSRGIVDGSRICPKNQQDGVCQKMSRDVFGTDLDDGCQRDAIRIVDLKSSGLDKLWDTLHSELPCAKGDYFLEDSNNLVYLTMPFMAEADKIDESSFVFSPTSDRRRRNIPYGDYEYVHVTSYGQHLTTEDFPPFGGSFLEFYDRLALHVYAISCAERP